MSRGQLEPEFRHPVQHLALVGDRRRHHHVVDRDPVGGDHQQVVLPLVDLADLARRSGASDRRRAASSAMLTIRGAAVAVPPILIPPPESSLPSELFARLCMRPARGWDTPTLASTAACDPLGDAAARAEGPLAAADAALDLPAAALHAGVPREVRRLLQPQIPRLRAADGADLRPGRDQGPLHGALARAAAGPQHHPRTDPRLALAAAAWKAPTTSPAAS